MTLYLNFHTIAAFLNAMCLGTMLFFAFVVTPVVFRTLAGETRTKFLSTIFPVYYRSLAGMSAVAGMLLFYRAEGWILLIVAGGFLFADLVLRPHIDANRNGHYAGDPAASGRFRRLHRSSLLINLAQMIASVIVFFRLAV